MRRLLESRLAPFGFDTFRAEVTTQFFPRGVGGAGFAVAPDRRPFGPFRPFGPPFVDVRTMRGNVFAASGNF